VSVTVSMLTGPASAACYLRVESVVRPRRAGCTPRDKEILMTPKNRLLSGFFLLLFGVLACAPPAQADLIGIRGGYYTKIEKPFAGVELLLRLGHSVYANPNVEYVFIDGTTFMTFNLDFHIDLPTHGRGYLWVGAGLAALYDNPKGPRQSTTDFGANLLAGIGLRGEVIPYVQAKYILKDDNEFVIAFGLRF
jgi:hypothetical protein